MGGNLGAPQAGVVWSLPPPPRSLGMVLGTWAISSFAILRLGPDWTADSEDPDANDEPPLWMVANDCEA